MSRKAARRPDAGAGLPDSPREARHPGGKRPESPLGHGGAPPRQQEYSAGGVVTRAGQVLLVKVRNLKGEEVWTFPKGHLDPGETPRQAALREVLEETGFACEVVGPLTLVRYVFQREGRLIRKRVRWYWMRPLEKAGEPDAREVLDVRWDAVGGAAGRLRYPGDKRLLARIEAKLLLVREGAS